MELNLNEITKTYRNKIAIDRFSASLQAGVYGLLGPNGAGKTTLMRMICGLGRPDAGGIQYDGRPIWELGEQYRRVLGYLPQNFGCYPSFTVRRYLEYIASLKGLSPGFSKTKIASLLETVGLADAQKAKISTLSGGMRQRLGIAQALLNEPDVIVLDEPTVGLDPSERVKFRNLISNISQGRITILSTHIVSDVSYIADQILLLQHGKLQRQGTVQELTAVVENRVWEVLVGREQAAEIADSAIVSNLHHTPEGVILRVVAEKRPFAHARPVRPTLEDAYLFYTGEKGGESNEI